MPKLGSKIIKIKNGKYKIYGNGLGSFFAKKNSLIDFGNSGTLARLLIGILQQHQEFLKGYRRSFFKKKKYEKINRNHAKIWSSFFT